MEQSFGLRQIKNSPHRYGRRSYELQSKLGDYLADYCKGSWGSTGSLD